MRNVELRITNYFTAADVSVGGDGEKVGRVKNYQALELYDNEPINVTLQAQDLKNPTARRLSYAGSFKIPATNKNNELLVWSYLLNQSQGIIETAVYDINLFNFPIKAQLYVNGFYIFDGELQLTGIERAITGINYEVTFILNNYSFFTLLKDIKFGESYIARPTSDFISVLEPIIPENWIWDSIILENYTQSGSTPSKRNLFPVIPFNDANLFPKATNKDLTSFINYAFDSWGTTTAKNSKHYWGFVDEGRTTIPSDILGTDVGGNGRILTDASPLIKSLSLAAPGYDKLRSFSLFENVKPYYFVSDIVRRIFRFIEYKLNTELFDLTTIPLESDIIHYPNYDNGTFTYPNIPIKFFFDSELLNAWDDTDVCVLDKQVLVVPENTKYNNPSIRVVVTPNLTNNISVQQTYTGSISVGRYPIDFRTTASEWDRNNGVLSVAIRNRLTSTVTLAASVTVTVFFNDISLGSRTFNYTVPTGAGIDNTQVINFVLEDNTYTNALANKINVKTILQNNNQYDNYVYTYVNYENLDLTYTGDRNPPSYDYTSENTNINFGYDLRRYLYPSLSEYSMSDFLVEVFRLFNAKVESPIFKAVTDNVSNIDRVSIKKYDELFNNAKIIELEEGINIFNLRKKQQFFKDFTIKYAENGDTLQEYFTKSFSPQLPFGSKYINFNNIEGFAQNSLEIELKCGIPTFIPTSTGGFDVGNSRSFAVPSYFNIINNNANSVSKIEPYTTYPPTFLFNNGVSDFDFITPITIHKRLFTNITSSTSRYHLLPVLVPFLYGSSFGDGEHLLYDVPLGVLRNNITKIIGSTYESNIFQKGYEQYYQSELNSLQGSTILEGDIDLSLIELFDINFNNIYTVRINGEFAYFRLNKLSNYNLAEDGMAKIELIEFDYISNRSNLYNVTVPFTSNNQFLNTDSTTSTVTLTFNSSTITGSRLVFDPTKPIRQYVTLIGLQVGGDITFFNGTTSVSRLTTTATPTYIVTIDEDGNISVTP